MQFFHVVEDYEFALAKSSILDRLYEGLRKQDAEMYSRRAKLGHGKRRKHLPSELVALDELHDR